MIIDDKTPKAAAALARLEGGEHETLSEAIPDIAVCWGVLIREDGHDYGADPAQCLRDLCGEPPETREELTQLARALLRVGPPRAAIYALAAVCDLGELLGVDEAASLGSVMFPADAARIVADLDQGAKLRQERVVH